MTGAVLRPHEPVSGSIQAENTSSSKADLRAAVFRSHLRPTFSVAVSWGGLSWQREESEKEVSGADGGRMLVGECHLTVSAGLVSPINTRSYAAEEQRALFRRLLNRA